MDVTLVLADAAQVVGGKLYVLGGGWTWTAPSSAGQALACVIEVGPRKVPRSLRWLARLVDEAGQIVLVPTDEGDAPAYVDGDLLIDAPPDPTDPVRIPLALTFGPMTLPPGRKLAWELLVNGEGRDSWRVWFRTGDTV